MAGDRRRRNGGRDNMEPEITEFAEWEEVFFSIDPTLREAWADCRAA